MKFSVKKALLATAAFGIVSMPASVVAQTGGEAAEDADDGAIIVTARKKEETLLEAPLAVSVFGREELENAAFTDITEITKAAPGAFVEPFNDRFARIRSTPRFRGVVVLNGSRLAQTATVFLDGIYMSGSESTLSINELERVEIIKGPQSALFGRNTFAGAINYVSRDPGDEFRVDVSGVAQTRDEYSLRASVEVPFFDGVSFRLGANYDTKDGHFANNAVDGQRLGDESQWSVAGTLLVNPSDSFKLKLRASYQRVDDGAPAAQQVTGPSSHNFGGFLINPDGTVDVNDSVLVPPRDGTRTESVFRGRINGTRDVGMNSGPDDIALFRTFQNDARFDPTDAINQFRYNPLEKDDFGLDLDSLRLSAALTVDLTDNIQFNFLGGYNEENFGFYRDFDLSPDQSFLNFSASHIEDLTLEGRLSGNFLDDRLFVEAGVSFVKIDIEELSGTGSFFGPTIFFGDLFRSDPFRTGAETFGIFGSIEYEFTDWLSVTLEGRFQEDQIREDEVNVGLATPISPSTISNFLPRATVRITPTDNTTLYATYSEGNLPGGFNQDIGELTPDQLAELALAAPGAGITFDEEKLTNYEIGWKQQHPDGTFAFNLAAFYMRRSDEIFVAIQTVSDPDTGVRTVGFTSNGATTDILGVELDWSLLLSETFSVQGSFAYIDATIDSFPDGTTSGDFNDIFGPAANVAGQEAPRFPPLTISLSGTYEDDANGFLGFDSWYVRGDSFFRGSFFTSNANVARVKEAFDVNLRAGLRGENMGLEFFVTNLFDEDAPTSANNFADITFDTRTRPGGFFDFSREGNQIGLRDRRQFGLRLNYTFR